MQVAGCVLTTPAPVPGSRLLACLAPCSCIRPKLRVTWATNPGNNNSSISNSNKPEDLSLDENRIWSQLAFPTYLQSKNKHKPEVCREFDKAVTAAERRQVRGSLGLDASLDDDEDEEEQETVWHTIRREAERDAAAEPLLSSFLYASILAHDTFERALAFVLSNRLANAVMLPTQLFEIFHEVLVSVPDVREGALADVESCRDRDPACTSYSQALLYYKGYHAIQTHRIAHALWSRGQKVMAVALQSRMSEVLAVDIHPAARFGRGILLDHGTGVVVGETAVIGNNVSLLQNVTLGGTGKDHGDRHPKISDNVLIGACATVLGNIRVGEGAQIAAGSLVLKPVDPHTMVAGSPAKAVGHVTGNPAEKMQQWSKKLLNWDPFAESMQPQPFSQQQHKQQRVQASSAAAAEQGGPEQIASSSSSSSDDGWTPAVPSESSKLLAAAAAEAQWDTIAAQVAAEGGCTSSSEPGSTGRTYTEVAHAAVAGSVTAAKPFSNGTNQVSQRSPDCGSSSSSSSGGLGRQVLQSQTADSRVSSSNNRQLSPAVPMQSQQQQQQQPISRAVSSSGASHDAAEAEAGSAGGAATASSSAAAAATVSSSDGSGAAGVSQPAQRPGTKQASAALQGLHEGDVEATLDEEVAAEKWSSRKEEPEYVI